MNWDAELAYFVTPKSGPMRAMRTLRDVNQALLDDLPTRSRYQRHWYFVGRLVAAAAERSSRLDSMRATDALVAALEVEGWMTPQAEIHVEQPDAPPPSPRADQFETPQALAA
jgi:hypothetical protein